MKKTSHFFFLCTFAVSHLFGQSQENIQSLTLSTPTNKAFKCFIDGKSYFLRIGRAHPELLGIDREKEIRNLKIGEKLGIAPTLFGYETDNGLLITEFIDGVMPSRERLHDSKFRSSVVNNFRLLHSYPAYSSTYVEKTMFEVCRNGYHASKHLLDNEGEVSHWLQVMDCFEDGYYDNIAKAYCHGDIYFGNLLETSSGKVYFIDWEYAYFGYVIDDLGKFCSDALSDDEIMHVVEEYWGDSKMFVKMKQNVFMHSLYHFLWCHIQSENDPKNTWYSQRIQLMRDYLNQVS